MQGYCSRICVYKEVFDNNNNVLYELYRAATETETFETGNHIVPLSLLTPAELWKMLDD